MITLLVMAITGHYSIPGQVGMGGTAFSTIVPAPSTVRGMLEALTGSPFGSFRGRLAYGRLREPRGHGFLYTKRHVWGSVQAPRCFSSGKESHDQESIRPIHMETWFDVAYCIQVEGPWVEKIRAALRGEVFSSGVLYLGTSDDLVHWIDEMTDPLDFIEWVVPGNQFRLTAQSGRGYGTLNAVWGTYDLRVGQPQWVLDTERKSS